MKKFKHKVTGKIASQVSNITSYSIKGESHTYPSWMIEDSNDWEEMIEYKCTKDYEVLFYKSQKTDRIINNETFNVAPDSSYWNIFSVKRLSDGEVFTIGDKVIHCNNVTTKVATITGFSILSNEIWFNTDVYNVPMSLIKGKYTKTKLFTTEDGVDIYPGSTFCYVDLPSYKLQLYQNGFFTASLLSPIYEDSVYFSTKEKAIDYIVKNKPCLSFMDIIELMRTHSDSKIVGALEELVKSKLQ